MSFMILWRVIGIGLGRRSSVGWILIMILGVGLFRMSYKKKMDGKWKGQVRSGRARN